jgi:hypothetical protein
MCGCTRAKQHDSWTTETEPAGKCVPELFLRSLDKKKYYNKSVTGVTSV